MDDTWLTGIADDLARCLVDAEACAEACERLLEAAKESDDADLQQRLVDALAATAAVARILSDLIDLPPPLVLAAARVCRDRGQEAIAQLEALGGRIDGGHALPALRAFVASSTGLLDAAG